MDRTTTIIICLCALVPMACEEAAPPSKVSGTVKCSACAQDEFRVSGELSEGDSKHYGYCKTDDENNLKFVVGTTDKAHATASSDFYLQITGIKGPPSVGVYSNSTTQTPNDGPTTDFDQGYIKNVNEFAFSQGDATDESRCVVRLYAEPSEGELDPNQASFDYFVWLDCWTLEVDSSNGAETLHWVEARLWFSNCD